MIVCQDYLTLSYYCSKCVIAIVPDVPVWGGGGAILK